MSLSRRKGFFREDFLGYQEQEGKGKKGGRGGLYAVPVVSLKVDKRRGLCLL